MYVKMVYHILHISSKIPDLHHLEKNKGLPIILAILIDAKSSWFHFAQAVWERWCLYNSKEKKSWNEQFPSPSFDKMLTEVALM